jgi:hypothetical protein
MRASGRSTFVGWFLAAVMHEEVKGFSFKGEAAWDFDSWGWFPFKFKSGPQLAYRAIRKSNIRVGVETWMALSPEIAIFKCMANAAAGCTGF